MVVNQVDELREFGDYLVLKFESNLEDDSEPILYLNSKFYTTLYTDSEFGYAYIELKTKNLKSKSNNSKLVKVKSKKSEDEITNPHKKLGYVNSTFLSQVFKQVDDNLEPTIYIWSCEPTLLTQVIITFNLSQQKDLSSTDTLNVVKRCILENLILLKRPIYQNDTINLTSNTDEVVFNFSFCEPTKQGLLSETTSFILVPNKDLESGQSNTDELTDLESESEVDEDVQESINPFNFINNTFSSNGVQSQPALSLSIRKLDSLIDIQPHYPSIPNLDLHSIVLLPLKHLKELQVVSGDWVLLSVIIEGSSNSNKRYCQVLGLDTQTIQQLGLQSELLLCDGLIDPLLYFHLFQNDNSVINPTINLTKPTDSENYQPKVAGSVTLVRINSSISNLRVLQPVLASALKQHFSASNRLVKIGDIIVVKVDSTTVQLQPKMVGNTEATTKLSLVPTTSYQLCYFKVSNLKLPDPTPHTANQLKQLKFGLLVDPNVTQTVQQGSEPSRIPANLCKYFNLQSNSVSRSQPFDSLEELIRSSLHPLATDLDLYCSVLLHGARGSGKSTLTRRLADYFGLHLFEFNCYDWVEESDTKTDDNFNKLFLQVQAYAPCILLIQHIDAIAKKFSATDVSQEPWLTLQFATYLNKLHASCRKNRMPVVVIATTESLEPLPPRLISTFKHDISITAPDEHQRLQVLQSLTDKLELAADIDTAKLATESAGLVNKDLNDLVNRATQTALTRLSKLPPLATKAGVQLTQQDFDLALNKTRAQYSDFIGAPKIPNVTWDDVGGLIKVKSAILDTIQLPLQRPELFAAGAKQRSGILLFGPPGTGKTLLAKAVATSCSLNFFSVKGPELLNMYIGESEANVRKVFQKARDAKPCVIFFDELDSVAPKRGEQGDSGGVMDRIVSQLLAELDGMGKGDGENGSGPTDVFVIGATNRPDLLDPALLRPGRFDKMLYLGVPEDHQSQLNIILALTRKLDPELDLKEVAEQCPFHYTGADFYALCSDAMLKAMSRTAETLESKLEEYNLSQATPVTITHYLDSIAEERDVQVTVKLVDFLSALQELTPSVTPNDLERYKVIRNKFQNLGNEDEQDTQTEISAVGNQVNGLVMDLGN